MTQRWKLSQALQEGRETQEPKGYEGMQRLDTQV